ncbi:hypothetical protein FVE85_8725 [Porphyridium purpureum]|uniref:MARVEL domain-containing protein n=1 Tax=Porphyridium purpureum TaxID=35688 RepID=A0A5J4YQL3_PORPP|nr:hypothetical protein FVE85_8725 [Porphyridium purpureum]|eukprot:POR1226..scf296_7
MMDLSVKAKLQLYTLILAVASLIEFGSVADFCSNLDNCTGRIGWALASGVISFVISAAYFALYKFKEDLADKFDAYVSGFMVLWWTVTVPFTTSDFAVGNVYYFSWVAFFAAIMWCFNCLVSRGIVSPDDVKRVVFERHNQQKDVDEPAEMRADSSLEEHRRDDDALEKVEV